jgi:NAD(P)-dependent dehydrogenase (short-subunit alcohol dehydrogenase family)
MERGQKYLSIAKLFDLSDEVAIVTGGTAGIGLAITKRLAEAGATVVMAARDHKRGQGISQELSCTGHKVTFLKCDVSQELDINNLFETTVKTFGGLDILVNNVAAFPNKPISEMDLETYTTVMDTNVRATYLCCAEAAKQMIKQGRGGSIINIASASAFMPTIGFTAYDSSKAAVVMLTRTLALELAPHNIRVNSLSPGLTMTTFLSAPEVLARESWRFSRIPLRHYPCRAEEQANVVLFLASPASSYMTGSDIVNDGGLTLTAIHHRDALH